MGAFLLDTHVVLWYAENNPQLSATVVAELTNSRNTLFISTATWWEIAIKYSIGKLKLPRPLPDLIADFEFRNFRPLPVSTAHILLVSQLPFPDNGHRDPFDRMLIAQALEKDLTLLSRDDKLGGYAVRRQF